MTTSIYLDNSATTPLSDAAKQAMIGALDCYGNPSSLHSVGQDAERLLTKAREQVLAGERIRDRKHRYFTCPRCHQTVRVPRGKGKIAITCPKCKEKFTKKT